MLAHRSPMEGLILWESKYKIQRESSQTAIEQTFVRFLDSDRSDNYYILKKSKPMRTIFWHTSYKKYLINTLQTKGALFTFVCVSYGVFEINDHGAEHSIFSKYSIFLNRRTPFTAPHTLQKCAVENIFEYFPTWKTDIVGHERQLVLCTNTLLGTLHEMQVRFGCIFWKAFCSNDVVLCFGIRFWLPIPRTCISTCTPQNNIVQNSDNAMIREILYVYCRDIFTLFTHSTNMLDICARGVATSGGRAFASASGAASRAIYTEDMICRRLSTQYDRQRFHGYWNTVAM